MMRVMVTGGAGFIGSALIRQLIRHSNHSVLCYDKLTYAGCLSTIQSVQNDPRCHFVRGDICDATAVGNVVDSFRPDIVVHLAAESHVDRSIDGPGSFVDTNIVGTYILLSEMLRHWSTLNGAERERFRFHHVSTDEVYGSLGETGLFQEETNYDPRSPYSASKASADHLVAAWGHSYGLPTLTTNCSNNYGPYHFPEKLIPLTIVRALSGETLPVYGSGAQIRDWLHVEDHVRALQTVFEHATPGSRYNIGGRNERRNLEVVEAICALLDELVPRSDGKTYREQIRHVADRPGHDQRYAIDASRIEAELGWRAQETFETGLRKTVRWYLDNEAWWRRILIEHQADRRHGLAA